MELQTIKQCDRCGVKQVKWSNDSRLLTSQAEKMWDNPLHVNKRNSLLQSEVAFQGKVCNHLRDKQDCLFADN